MYFATGCFRFGTGLIGRINLIWKNESIWSALECQTLCQSTTECKLFNWNQDSNACFIRSDLPKGFDSFNENVPKAIIGARDCSDFRIIWPEVYGLDITLTTITTTTTTKTSTTATTTTSTSVTTTTELTESATLPVEG